MRIAFISYWGINDGLTQATVIPHLEFLNSMEKISHIDFFTIERKGEVKPFAELSKVKHHPVMEDSKLPGMKQFVSLRRIYQMLGTFSPELIFARSSLAAVPAYHYYKKTKTPYVVESFEPHAEYMVESGEWKKGGAKYKLLKRYEDREIKTARFLLPVSNNYRDLLIQKGVSKNNILTLPCTVDMNRFKRDIESRAKIRKELGGDDDTIVGVYLGKFGGLYEEKQAFVHFRTFLSEFEKYKMLVLSPEEKEQVVELAKSADFPLDMLEVRFVSHHEVPDYLSAADISFATYKNTPSNKYLSPIKVGEYLACGLFVVIMDGVGDDAVMMPKANVGITISDSKKFRSTYDAFTSDKAVEYADKHRSRKVLENCYNQILSEI